MLPIAANSGTVGQVQSRLSSRVRSPGRFTDAVALRSQTALTGSARPGQYRQREHGHPLPPTDPECLLYVNGGPGIFCFAPAARRWRRRSGSASGSVGERAVAAGASGPAGRLETVQKVLTRMNRQ
jgi:hypothetical protein